MPLEMLPAVKTLAAPLDLADVQPLAQVGGRIGVVCICGCCPRASTIGRHRRSSTRGRSSRRRGGRRRGSEGSDDGHAPPAALFDEVGHGHGEVRTCARADGVETESRVVGSRVDEGGLRDWGDQRLRLRGLLLLLVLLLRDRGRRRGARLRLLGLRLVRVRIVHLVDGALARRLARCCGLFAACGALLGRLVPAIVAGARFRRAPGQRTCERSQRRDGGVLHSSHIAVGGRSCGLLGRRGLAKPADDAIDPPAAPAPPRSVFRAARRRGSFRCPGCPFVSVRGPQTSRARN